MRVTCLSVEDFLENLSDPEVKPHVAVYFSKTQSASEESSPRDAAVVMVTVHVTAVLEREDDTWMLLEVSEDCGFDYRDASQEYGGSERAGELRKIIQDFCDGRGWKVLPGVVDMS